MGITLRTANQNGGRETRRHQSRRSSLPTHSYRSSSPRHTRRRVPPHYLGRSKAHHNHQHARTTKTPPIRPPTLPRLVVQHQASLRRYLALRHSEAIKLATGSRSLNERCLLRAAIQHLLVWSKTPIPVDDEKGDVTPESRRLIEEFIEEFFVRPLGATGKDQVQWFKNWVSLQSVRGVDS